ncbi:MAG: hypothetical protein AB7P35_17590 [Hyphomonadaceae bacterium]
MPREALPALAAEAGARRAQLDERAFWMGRDLQQALVNREMCAKLGELVSLVEANNAGVDP